MEILILIFTMITFVEAGILVALLKKKTNFGRKSKIVSKKPKKEKFDIKKVKPEQWVVFFIYALVIGFIGYIVISNYIPDLLKPINSGEYIIDGSVDVLKSFYFEKDVFGEKQGEYYPIVSEEINKIIFTPKKIISEEQGVLEIEGLNNGTDLYINDKLVVPNLENYIKVRDFSDSEVYVRKDYSYEEVDRDKLEDYLYSSFPQAEVYSFKSLDDSIPVLMDYEQEWTVIGTTFRHELNLAVYHGGGQFKFKFTKQDFNACVGKDEYKITIKNEKGELVFSKDYKDDGDSKDSNKLGEEQDFSEGINLERGIYSIYFDRDNNNKWEDSSIKDIRINSNKILITGKILPYDNFKFYTQIYKDTEIKFRTYWRDEFKIRISGDINKDLKIKKGEDIYLNLSRGEYYLSESDWKVWITKDIAFSPSKKNWFNIPTESVEKMFSPDVIVINKNVLNLEGEKFYLKFDLDIKPDDSIKFQVLDADKLFIKQIKLEI